ncbi:putative membrane protein [Emiliania huxleyi virus 18]|nr:putative membrane protein [Emiliania huxleyi virus 18]AHA55380.1 putative membrane protein [Emiliania huxleyi virus 156]
MVVSENVILDEFDEIPNMDGVFESDEPSVDITDPVDPLAVSLAAENTDEIGLPGNDGPPEIDIPQHPYRVEQESS